MTDGGSGGALEMTCWPLDPRLTGAARRHRPSMRLISCVSHRCVGAPCLTLMTMATVAIAVSACPKSCHCAERNGVVVQCTSRSLDSIPLDLPEDTVVLLLSYNRIRRVPDAAFEGLRRLRELDLSHNAIESVEAGAFRGAWETLRTLDLSDNRLSGVPRDAFSRVRARVRLAHNPWHCGCSLQETLRELRLDPDTVNQVSCLTSARQEYVGLAMIQVLDSGVNFCNFHHKTMDVAMFVAMFLWFSMVIAYVVSYVRHNKEDARRHMEYLKSLPGAASHISKDYDTASSSML